MDLWSHLVEIKSCSFNRAIKRKRDLDQEKSLCGSMDGLKISRSRSVSLPEAFKKLCVDDGSMPEASESEEKDAGEPCSAVGVKTTSPEVFSSVVDSGLQQQQASNSTLATFNSSGNGEASLVFGTCSPQLG